LVSFTMIVSGVFLLGRNRKARDSLSWIAGLGNLGSAS
jgi:hypothetical protein